MEYAALTKDEGNEVNGSFSTLCGREDMPSRSFRNKNPGNIRHHNAKGEVYPVVKRWGGVDDGDNYARFKSIPEGCAALADLLASAYKDLTVAQMIDKYAPSNDMNDPDKYTRTVCGWAEIDSKEVIKELEPVKFFELCKGITRVEGWNKIIN
jgi:hypothetical protein